MNNRIVLDNSCTKEVEFFQVGNLKTRWFLDFCQIFFLTKKKFQLDLQWRPMPTKWHLAKLSMSLSSISRKKMSFKNICFKIDKKVLITNMLNLTNGLPWPKTALDFYWRFPLLTMIVNCMKWCLLLTGFLKKKIIICTLATLRTFAIYAFSRKKYYYCKAKLWNINCTMLLQELREKKELLIKLR